MSEDEKKAIEIIKKEITKPETTPLEVYVTDIKMLLHIIEKQQKEIEQEKNKDFEKYWVSIDDYNKLKRQIKIKDEYLSLIIGLGFDYDGEDTSVEGLKSVIDQLVDYAKKAIDNDDKSPIYGIDDAVPKRNILLEELKR